MAPSQAKNIHETHLGNRDKHVKLEGEDGASQQHDEDPKGSVLKISQLHLTRPELNPPANVAVDGRNLEPHGLPVCALDVLSGKRWSVTLWRTFPY